MSPKKSSATNSFGDWMNPPHEISFREGYDKGKADELHDILAYLRDAPISGLTPACRQLIIQFLQEI